MDDVPRLHHVLLPLNAVLARSLDVRHGRALAVLLEVRKADDLRLDEAPLKVGVDDACGLRRQRPLLHGPAPDLLLASREKIDERQLRIPLLHNLGQHTLCASVGRILQSSLGVGVIPRLPQRLLVLYGDHDAAAVALDPLVDLGQPLVLLADEVRL